MLFVDSKFVCCSLSQIGCFVAWAIDDLGANGGREKERKGQLMPPRWYDDGRKLVGSEALGQYLARGPGTSAYALDSHRTRSCRGASGVPQGIMGEEDSGQSSAAALAGTPSLLWRNRDRICNLRAPEAICSRVSSSGEHLGSGRPRGPRASKTRQGCCPSKSPSSMIAVGKQILLNLAPSRTVIALVRHREADRACTSAEPGEMLMCRRLTQYRSTPYGPH